MKRYSVFAIAREALRYHTGWERAWRSPEPKKPMTRSSWARAGMAWPPPITWARTTASQCGDARKGLAGRRQHRAEHDDHPVELSAGPSAAIYEKARSLYETLSQDLNYNVMFSPRGVMMLAQTHHEVRGYLRTAHANALQGVETEFITPQRVKELCPIMNIDGPRYPVLGALWQARGGTGGMMRWPGAMRGPVPTWAWTSSSNAR
jgi:sarcosine oxidase, subunit beta